MFKKWLKYFLKNSRLVHGLCSMVIFLYLKLVYLTSKWSFSWEEDIEPAKIDSALFALWHNQLAFGMYIFKHYNNVFALASSHIDGKIITDIIKMMGYKVVEGSTNRNPTGAVKTIIKLITTGNKIVITPDGPRGPLYKINSNITRIAYKYNAPLIPLACIADNYIELKSWDKMIIPKPFSKISVIIGAPIKLSGNEAEDNLLLEENLLKLLKKSKSKLLSNNKN